MRAVPGRRAQTGERAEHSVVQGADRAGPDLAQGGAGGAGGVGRMADGRGHLTDARLRCEPRAVARVPGGEVGQPSAGLGCSAFVSPTAPKRVDGRLGVIEDDLHDDMKSTGRAAALAQGRDLGHGPRRGPAGLRRLRDARPLVPVPLLPARVRPVRAVHRLRLVRGVPDLCGEHGVHPPEARPRRCPRFAPLRTARTDRPFGNTVDRVPGPPDQRRTVTGAAGPGPGPGAAARAKFPGGSDDGSRTVLRCRLYE